MVCLTFFRYKPNKYNSYKLNFILVRYLDSCINTKPCEDESKKLELGSTYVTLGEQGCRRLQEGGKGGWGGKGDKKGMGW